MQFYLDVRGVDDKDVSVVNVGAGSLALISYAAREAAELTEDAAGEFRVQLNEIDAEGNPGRLLISLTADGDTVNTVVKTRLAKMRKAEKQAPEPTE